jgi:hypothetical protein
MIGYIKVQALGVLRDSGVARGCIELSQEGTLCNFPRKGVLASARADEEHVIFCHFTLSSTGSWFA